VPACFVLFFIRLSVKEEAHMLKLARVERRQNCHYAKPGSEYSFSMGITPDIAGCASARLTAR
jgi:hypothetical protein